MQVRVRRIMLRRVYGIELLHENKTTTHIKTTKCRLAVLGKRKLMATQVKIKRLHILLITHADIANPS